MMDIIHFTSESTARITTLLLGYIPDYVVMISDHGDTSPDRFEWFNTLKYSGWTTALSLLTTGTTGVVTRDTTGITAFTGGQASSSEETADNYIYYDADSTAVTVTAGLPLQPGIRIPADHQANSGKNVVVCFRSDR